MRDDLRSTVDLVRRAYPNGLTNQQRLGVIANLEKHMGFRGVAQAVGEVLGMPYAELLNDVYRAAAGQVSDADVVVAHEALVAAGFEQWVAEP